MQKLTQEQYNALLSKGYTESQVADISKKKGYGLPGQKGGGTLANFGVERLVHDHEELYKKLLASQAKS